VSTGQKAVFTDLVNARDIGMNALASAEAQGSEKVAPVKVNTFAAKPAKAQFTTMKANKIYQEESAVVRSLRTRLR
jgi:hypothetical protein